ncbi:hypothetical protein [Cohnella sp. 56]|uniref:hypothetical protein n=1 Tax=Cohnella sp. 56 TaxID=3113722 RepID=UPI0030E87470
MSGEDGWLEALAGWTVQALDDAQWHVHAGGWPAEVERPAVMWRLTGAETKPASAAFAEETRRYAGHVLGRDPAEQALAVGLLASALGVAYKLPLDAAERRYLRIRQAAAELTADAIADGQLQLTLCRRAVRPSAEAPLMREVAFHQKEE